jgi:hypothetical protein
MFEKDNETVESRNASLFAAFWSIMVSCVLFWGLFVLTPQEKMPIVISIRQILIKLFIQIFFKLNISFASRWQPFNLKKRRNVGTAYRKEGTTKYPCRNRHTHAKWREHLMCLLCFYIIIFGRFTLRNNSLNATNKNCVFRNSITNIAIIS